ncbi:MAG: YdeI/OmpD-associated family protein [Alphaproteobacteria bacterium]|nr:YdeI/OmpD-associated family protein [Alphaproteobacteria bacterium]
MVADLRVDAYIARAHPFAQPLLARIRAAIHAAAPGLDETIKWGMPFFVKGGVIVAHMAGFKAHCAIGIWNADVDRVEGAMGTFGRIASEADLPPDAELAAAIRARVAAIDAGAKRMVPKRAPKPELPVPDDLAAALAANPTAQTVFAAFPPSQRREYIEWITAAKRAETRARRLEQALGLIADGKPQNWKYR